MPFAHENLKVYQESIKFVSWTSIILEKIPAKYSVRDQLDRASTSIPLNIAEGNVKRSSKDRSRFWQIANGSCVECASCLDVIVARGFLPNEEVEPGKTSLLVISKMLFGLLSKFEFDCQILDEEAAGYGEGDVIEEEDEDGG
ncbi:MAG: four helix bundle protein [Verrucomicrobiota bacterium]